MTMRSEDFVSMTRMIKLFFLPVLFCVLGLLSIAGCSGLFSASRPAEPVSVWETSEESRPVGSVKDSARYEYLVSQMCLTQEQWTLSETHLKKAIAKDPDSSFLQRSLIRLYLFLGHEDQENHGGQDTANQKYRNQALVLTRKLAREHPHDVENLFLLLDVDKEQTSQDLSELLARILKLAPKNREAWLRLGKIYMEKQDLPGAVDLFSRMTRKLPHDYTAWFYLGEACMKYKDFFRAKKAFSKSIELEPDLLEARFRLAQIVRTGKQIQNTDRELQDIYGQILAIDPGNRKAQMEMALVYSRQKKRKQADRLFEKLISGINDDPHWLMLAADDFITSQRPKDGIIIFSRLRKAMPDNDYVNFLAGMLHESAKDLPGAVECYKAISPALPKYKKVVLNIALLYREMNQTKKAVRFLEQRHEQHPDDVDITLYLLSFYKAQDLVDKAFALALASVEKEPENPSLLFHLGELYDRKHDKPKCIEIMKRLILIAPEDANALNYLGYTYAETGQHLDKALALLQRAISIKPEDGYIMDSLGWVYFQKGDYDTAVTHLEKAVQATGYEPTIADHLAQTYVKIHKPQRALAVYQEAVKRAHSEKKHKDAIKMKEKIQALKARMDKVHEK